MRSLAREHEASERGRRRETRLTRDLMSGMSSTPHSLPSSDTRCIFGTTGRHGTGGSDDSGRAPSSSLIQQYSKADLPRKASRLHEREAHNLLHPSNVPDPGTGHKVRRT